MTTPLWPPLLWPSSWPIRDSGHVWIVSSEAVVPSGGLAIGGPEVGQGVTPTVIGSAVMNDRLAPECFTILLGRPGPFNSLSDVDHSSTPGAIWVNSKGVIDIACLQRPK